MGLVCSTRRRVSPKQNHSACKNNNDDDFRNRESISVPSAEIDNAAEHANKPETPPEASSSRLVLKEKEKKTGEFDKDDPQPKRISLEKTNQQDSRSETPSPMHHITWDGFEESWEPIGQKCLLCDMDLANEPIDEEAYYHDAYMEDEVVFSPPDVAVLACGHAFHDKCLLFITPEDQSTDPPCFFCGT